MTSFSFHPVKTIAMGEGGAVTTNDGRLAERLRRLRAHGMVRDEALLQNESLAFDGDGRANPWYYEMPDIGLNYRVTDLQCALGLSQMKKLARFVARRQALADRYDRKVADLAPLVQPIARSAAADPAWPLYHLLTHFDPPAPSSPPATGHLK